MLKIERFRLLALSYGADLRRWPSHERPYVEALLEISPLARHVFGDAQADDAIMGLAPGDGPAPRRAPGNEQAALARVRLGVASRIAAPPRRAGRWWWQGWMPRMVVGGGFAVAAGLWVGSMHAMMGSIELIAALQPRSVLGLGW